MPTKAIPALEELHKDGESDRRKICVDACYHRAVYYCPADRFHLHLKVNSLQGGSTTLADPMHGMDRFNHFNDGRLCSSDVAWRVDNLLWQTYFYRNLAGIMARVLLQRTCPIPPCYSALVHSPQTQLDDINHVNRRPIVLLSVKSTAQRHYN